MQMTPTFTGSTGDGYIAEQHGSLFLLWPQTQEARAHLIAHLDPEALWFGQALVVEPRYIADLVHQLREDGFTVR
jgi:hypothetical protein